MKVLFKNKYKVDKTKIFYFLETLQPGIFSNPPNYPSNKILPPPTMALGRQLGFLLDPWWVLQPLVNGLQGHVQEDRFPMV
jgi:hypothetical protein